MGSAFWMGAFNGDLSNWDVSSVTVMSNMFAQAAFNNDSIENWNTASLESLNGPFYKNYGLNVNLSNWNILNFNNALTSNWAYRTGIDNVNYTDTIVGWAVQVYNNNNLPTGINAAGSGKAFDGARTSDNKAGQAYNVKYSNWPSGWTTAQDAFDYLVYTTNWSL